MKLDDTCLLQMKHAAFWITEIKCCVWMVCLTDMYSIAHTYVHIYLLPYIHLQEIHPKDVEIVTINTDTECLLNYICHNNTNVSKFT